MTSNPLEVLLRDVFAVHAPEPPDWFEIPDAVTVPDTLDVDLALAEDDGWAKLSERQKRHLRDWMRDPSLALEDKTARQIGVRVLALMDQRDQDRAQAIQTNLIERYFAWRWFYADQMLFWRAAERDATS
jgi:hypothetical protein